MSAAAFVKPTNNELLFARHLAALDEKDQKSSHYMEAVTYGPFATEALIKASQILTLDPADFESAQRLAYKAWISCNYDNNNSVVIENVVAVNNAIISSDAPKTFAMAKCAIGDIQSVILILKDKTPSSAIGVYEKAIDASAEIGGRATAASHLKETLLSGLEASEGVRDLLPPVLDVGMRKLRLLVDAKTAASILADWEKYFEWEEGPKTLAAIRAAMAPQP